MFLERGGGVGVGGERENEYEMTLQPTEPHQPGRKSPPFTKHFYSYRMLFNTNLGYSNNSYKTESVL